jgi:hypothetical protein
LSLSFSIAYSYPSLVDLSIVIVLLLILALMIQFWPSLFQLVPLKRDAKLGQTAVRWQIAKMTFAVKNASAGSVFYKGEINGVLRERLLGLKQGSVPFETGRTRKSRETITVPENYAEDLKRLLSAADPHLNTRGGRLADLVLKKHRSSAKYLDNLEKAIDYVELQREVI